jgi:hypothetical protein
MDSGLAVSSSMEARREKAVLQALAHFEGIGADRGREPGMDWCDAVEGEELAAGDAVDVQCSRVEPAEDDAAEDPAARGGDDAA